MRCLGTVALKQRTEEGQRLRRLERDAARNWFSALGFVLEGDDGDLLGVVPSFDRELAPVDPDRIEALRLSLTQAIEDAMRLVASGDAPSRSDEGSDEDASPAVLEVACATCKGACCRSGGTHAYLTGEDMALKLRHEPLRTAVEMVDAYLACVPAMAYDESCIFHAERGCTLPREARSRICNRHRCGGLKELAGALDLGTSANVHVAACRNGRIRRAVSARRDESSL